MPQLQGNAAQTRLFANYTLTHLLHLYNPPHCCCSLPRLKRLLMVSCEEDAEVEEKREIENGGLAKISEVETFLPFKGSTLQQASRKVKIIPGDARSA